MTSVAFVEGLMLSLWILGVIGAIYAFPMMPARPDAIALIGFAVMVPFIGSVVAIGSAVWLTAHRHEKRALHERRRTQFSPHAH